MHDSTTDLADALLFIERFAESLRQLSDVKAVRVRVMELEHLAKGFPETRFCKGCVLPIVDALANSFLSERYSVGSFDVFQSLRCEGFHNLREYYSIGNGRTGFSSYARGNTHRADCKQGSGRASRPSPDFCIRLRHPRFFRLLGETKFSLKPVSASRLKADLLHDLHYYLSIDSEPNSDWGHDFGVGIGYCAAGSDPRDFQCILDHWHSDRIALIVFGIP